MPMRIGDAIPKFEGATEWLNALAETADEYARGLLDGQQMAGAAFEVRKVGAACSASIIRVKT